MKRILVSDQSVNSYDFSVLTSGIDFSRFEGNPIMLFNHQRAMSGKTDDVLPIGTWKDLTVEGDKLYATPVFDETDAFALRIQKKFEAGIIRAASIGVSIQKMHFDDKTDSLVLSASQLQEISIVDIPSNQNAVAVYGDNDELLTEDAVLALAAGLKNSNKQIQKPKMKFDKSIALLNLSADATDEAVALAITNLKTTLATAESELEAVKAANAARLTAENESLVDAAIADKRITASQREAYLSVLTNDAENGRAILKSLTPVKTLASVAKPDATKTGEGDGTHQGKTFLQLSADNPAELARLKTENPEAYQRLYDAEFATEIQANERAAKSRTH